MVMMLCQVVVRRERSACRVCKVCKWRQSETVWKQSALELSQRVYESVISLGDSLPSNRACQRMSLKSDLWLQFLRVNIGKGGVAKH